MPPCVLALAVYWSLPTALSLEFSTSGLVSLTLIEHGELLAVSHLVTIPNRPVLSRALSFGPLTPAFNPTILLRQPSRGKPSWASIGPMAIVLHTSPTGTKQSHLDHPPRSTLHVFISWAIKRWHRFSARRAGVRACGHSPMNLCPARSYVR
jgi:hypothetical protein